MTTPNIVILLADDLGFSDIAPYGGEIETPALDRLARQGVQMNSFYVTPRCSPSRAALLTGRHPHSVGIGVLTSDDRPRGYRGSLRTDVPTLAERLRPRGYATGLFGKWHLASEMRTPSDTWPTRRGFDTFRGILSGATSYDNPPLVCQESRVDPTELGDGFDLTDDVAASSAQFVREHAAAGTPYFLLSAFTAPHWPLQARPDLIAKYRERYQRGWDAVRADRVRRIQERHLVPVDLPAEPTLGDWDAAAQPWEVERMAVYAAQVETLDRGIGRILDAVDESGTREETLVLFLSDNGGCAEELVPGTASFDELVCPPRTRDGRRVRFGNDPQIMPGGADTYQSYGETWATVSNTPFRRWKRWVHEGGISTPFLVSWPAGGIPTGRITDGSLGHMIDIVPSVLEAVGVQDADLEGASLLECWRSPQTDWTRRTLFWEHVGNAAVRAGRWKLAREWPGDWELYDMATDRTESHDLAAERPELVAALADDYATWATEHGVLDWETVLADYEARGIPRQRAWG